MEGGITGKGFLPGRSGNPAGRAKNPLSRKDRSIVGRVVFEQLCKIAKGEIKTAMRVQVSAAKIVLAYAWGLPVQEVDLAGACDITRVNIMHFSSPETCTPACQEKAALTAQRPAIEVAAADHYLDHQDAPPVTVQPARWTGNGNGHGLADSHPVDTEPEATDWPPEYR